MVRVLDHSCFLLLTPSTCSELNAEVNHCGKFNKDEVEQAYVKYSEPLHLLPYVAFVLVTISNSIIMLTILPK